jgi:hypothetical protein
MCLLLAVAVLVQPADRLQDQMVVIVHLLYKADHLY